jgi:hypothetical protein
MVPLLERGESGADGLDGDYWHFQSSQRVDEMADHELEMVGLNLRRACA